MSVKNPKRPVSREGTPDGTMSLWWEEFAEKLNFSVE